MLWLVVIVAVLNVVAGGVLLLGIADRMTASKRRRVEGSPADLGLRYEEIQFLTPDRLTLRGWYLERPASRATVVLVHDIGATRGDASRRLVQLQRDYVRRGYSVFSFDLRGHGESAGQRDSFGTNERYDVEAAVAYVRRRTPGTRVVLHGFGFGAALSLTVAAHNSDVDGVIADSSFESMRWYLRNRWPRLPSPVFSAALALARRWFGADANALKPIDSVAYLKVPVLYVHNNDDPEVPLAHTLNLAACSLNMRDRVWIVARRHGHATGYSEAPDLYMRHCLDFLDEVTPARTLHAQAV